MIFGMKGYSCLNKTKANRHLPLYPPKIKDRHILYYENNAKFEQVIFSFVDKIEKLTIGGR